MPATNQARNFARFVTASCEMRPDQRISNSKVIGTQTLVCLYANRMSRLLQRPDGYLILNQNGNGNALEAGRQGCRVRAMGPPCISQKPISKKKVCLWRCPQCDARPRMRKGLTGRLRRIRIWPGKAS